MFNGKKKTSRSLSTLFFMLRREPLYHKLQYSKVPKFDVAAAVLGVIVGAFVVYLALCSVGSAGADLSKKVKLHLIAVVWLKELALSIYFTLRKLMS